LNNLILLETLDIDFELTILNIIFILTELL
jgi:hypothetical protein